MKRTFISDIVLFSLAILATCFIVVSGFDWQYFQFVSQYSWLSMVFNPALVIGGILPMIISLIVIGFYWKFRETNWMKKLIIVFLALVSAIVIDSIMKAITGRPAPSMAVGLVDNSQIFRFGFMDGGIFWGWPSEHTMVAFAMATVFAKINSKNWKIVVLSYLYAFYIAMGVSLRIHWFSDVVAGILIGYAIGQTVAKWRIKIDGNYLK